MLAKKLPAPLLRLDSMGSGDILFSSSFCTGSGKRSAIVSNPLRPLPRHARWRRRRPKSDAAQSRTRA